MQFQKQEVTCLEQCLSRIQTLEQTQEIPLPEGGEGRVLGTWGQAVMRGKEWLTDSIRLTGGVQVWVLYETEGGKLQCLSSYIPFRMDWDLPEGTREGWVRIRPAVRSIDARPVSAGKLLIRAGISALAEGYCRAAVTVFSPEGSCPEAELLKTQWPVRLRREAGEKAFSLEEDLTLPESVPPVRDLLSWQLDTKVTDQKILGNRILFRGMGNLHVVYLSPEGQLRCWNFELPFSQYSELETACGADARGDIALAVTRLELEADEGGKLHLRSGLTGQYLVEDCQILETVEDAYSPYREITFQKDVLTLPVLLDSCREPMTSRQTLQISADVIADQVFYPDFPRQHREGEKICISQPGAVQILYYDPEGRLQGSVSRLEAKTELRLDREGSLTAVTGEAHLQLRPGRDNLELCAETELETVAFARQKIPMITGIEPGERRKAVEDRPSLVLCRMGDRRLWDLAREKGSTVSAIREANDLSGEPEKDRILLIPVV